jgi:uncharacterized protein YuzE
MKFSYDKSADVLYITFAHPTGTVNFVENDNGDILRYDQTTNALVGCTILFFARRLKSKEQITIPEIGSVPLNDKALALMVV